jgi:hypothetical protein
MRFLTEEDIDKIILESKDGYNTKFLKSSHNLWKRFQNYDKASPMGLIENNKTVAIIFATFNKNFYTNLYDIVTVEGYEGNGYASKIWDYYIDYAVKVKKMTRLKISCTPRSITWHMRNGLIFWGIDSSGSLKSDQPLFPTRNEQKSARSLYVRNPSLALPSPKVVHELLQSQIENYNFTDSKKSDVLEAIQKTGKFWFGDWLKRLR